MREITLLTGFIFGWTSAILISHGPAFYSAVGDQPGWLVLGLSILVLSAGAVALWMANNVMLTRYQITAAFNRIRQHLTRDQSTQTDEHRPQAPAPNPVGSTASMPTPASPTNGNDALDVLLEQIGERYLADLRGVYDAFARAHASELGARDAEISELRAQTSELQHERERLTLRITEVEGERDELMRRIQELERVPAHVADELEAVRAELSQRLATVSQGLGGRTGESSSSQRTRAAGASATNGAAAPEVSDTTANGSRERPSRRRRR